MLAKDSTNLFIPLAFSDNMLMIGVDEAGRGPVIGPMVVSGVLIRSEDAEELKEKGVRDSKLVPQAERIKLGKLIKEKIINYHIDVLPPKEIDRAVNGGENLNTLDAIAVARIVNQLNQPEFWNETITVIADCPSPNTLAWRATLLKYVEHSQNLEVKCEHKADLNYPCVSAASIIAKLIREEEVDKLKLLYGAMGSGYVSDPATKKFLKEQGALLKDSGIFRKSWATWKDLFPEPEKGQATLGEF